MTDRQAKQKLRQIQHKQKGMWKRSQNQPAHVANPAPQTITQAVNPQDQKPSKGDIKRDIALHHCYLDRVTNEKVFTVDTEPVIKAQIVAELGQSYLDANPLKYEFGESLNRFGI
jgi:hypothetical protein